MMGIIYYILFVFVLLNVAAKSELTSAENASSELTSNEEGLATDPNEETLNISLSPAIENALKSIKISRSAHVFPSTKPTSTKKNLRKAPHSIKIIEEGT